MTGFLEPIIEDPDDGLADLPKNRKSKYSKNKRDSKKNKKIAKKNSKLRKVKSKPNKKSKCDTSADLSVESIELTHSRDSTDMPERSSTPVNSNDPPRPCTPPAAECSLLQQNGTDESITTLYRSLTELQALSPSGPKSNSSSEDECPPMSIWMLACSMPT